MGPEVFLEKSPELSPRAAIDLFYQSENFNKLSDSSRTNYRYDLDHFGNELGETGTTNIKELALQLVSNHLSNFHKSPETFNRHRASIKKFLEWANDNGLVDSALIDNLPTSQKVEQHEPFDYIDEKEVKKLMGKSVGNLRDLRDLALITVALKTGAKEEEILGLDVEHIKSTPDGRLSITFTNHQGFQKSNFLDGEDAEIVRHLAENQESGPLFCNHAEYSGNTGKRLSRQGFWLIVKDLGGTINRPGHNPLTPRILHNTFVMNFQGNRADELEKHLGISLSGAATLLRRKRLTKQLQTPQIPEP